MLKKLNRLSPFGFGEKNGRKTVKCLCECGRITEPLLSNFKQGITKSCGCLQKENRIRHGKHGTPEYMSWTSMMDRCYNANDAAYHRYGGRGISVCDRWHAIDNFISDMGKRPKNTSLDRIDNDGNYCKENCRWADRYTQCSNRSTNTVLEIFGVRKTLTQWADYVGVNNQTISERLKRGWSHEKAVMYPKRNHKYANV